RLVRLLAGGRLEPGSERAGASAMGAAQRTGDRPGHYPSGRRGGPDLRLRRGPVSPGGAGRLARGVPAGGRAPRPLRRAVGFLPNVGECPTVPAPPWEPSAAGLRSGPPCAGRNSGCWAPASSAAPAPTLPPSPSCPTTLSTSGGCP